MSGFVALDLSRMAKPDVIETLDYEVILAALKVAFVARLAELGIEYNVAMLESDPAVKALEVAAYREVLLRARVNSALRARLLAYAQGSDLDHKGSDFEVARMITPATGDTPEVRESDDRFRRRIMLAPEAFATAGARGAYIFHALSADLNVFDAWAYCPQGPGSSRVDVVIAGANGAQVSQAVFNKVAAVFSPRPRRFGVPESYLDEKVRPLTDDVVVRHAQRVDYAVTITTRLQFGLDSALLKSEIEASVRKYAAARYQVGAEVYLSGITAAAQVSGVEVNTVMTPGAHVVCADNQIPFMASLTVTVLED